MNEHLKKLKDKKYDDTFDRTSEWLMESRNKLISQKNKKRKINMMKYVSKHKIQFAVIILAALLIAACNMPVTQNDTVGYALSWTAPGTASKIVSDKLNSFGWYKNSNVSVESKNANGMETVDYKFVAQVTDNKQIDVYRADLESIKELTSIKITPLNTSTKRPVYSAALHSFFKIDINSDNLTDEQVQAELSKQLEQAGFGNANVKFTQQSNGMKKFDIKFEGGFKTEGTNTLDIKIDNKNGKEVIKMKTVQDDVKFDKMTDEEIRTYVKEKNKEDNLTDKDITIKREGGNVSVNVNKEIIKDK